MTSSRTRENAIQLNCFDLDFGCKLFNQFIALGTVCTCVCVNAKLHSHLSDHRANIEHNSHTHRFAASRGNNSISFSHNSLSTIFLRRWRRRLFFNWTTLSWLLCKCSLTDANDNSIWFLWHRILTSSSKLTHKVFLSTLALSLHASVKIVIIDSLLFLSCLCLCHRQSTI